LRSRFETIFRVGTSVVDQKQCRRRPADSWPDPI
jgi:hypothetical protein